MRSMPDVLAAIVAGDGRPRVRRRSRTRSRARVRVVLDHLIFDDDLFIQREVVLPIRQNLLAPPGMTLADVRRIVSFPEALEQCRAFFADEPARRRARGRQLHGRGGPRRRRGAARRHGGARHRARRPSSTASTCSPPTSRTTPTTPTRFVLRRRARAFPPPTGHDKTSIVCFQRADRPGSLHVDPRPVHGPRHQPHQAASPARPSSQPRRLLLHHRLRGPRRRRGGGRLPARPPRGARRA